MKLLLTWNGRWQGGDCPHEKIIEVADPTEILDWVKNGGFRALDPTHLYASGLPVQSFPPDTACSVDLGQVQIGSIMVPVLGANRGAIYDYRARL